jgi:lichenan operon transcriptional antiterminator
MLGKDKLLLYLQKRSGWHTAQELAIEIGLSKRTVKNYIQQLRKQNNKILSSTKGYQYISSSSKDNRNSLPTSNEERINFIINLMINNNSKVNLYDLAEKLFISESTVLQNLKDVKQEVERFGIKLNRNGDFWSLEGSERQKRSLLSSLIYEESSGIFMNQNIIQQNFPELKINQLQTMISNVFKKESIYLNTFELNNILLHFAIALDRSKQGHQIDYIDEQRIVSNNGIGLRIVNQIIKKLHVNFSTPDCQELALVVETDLGNESTVQNVISIETKKLVDDLIEYVWQIYAINLNTQSFKKRFSLHLDRLIIRSRLKVNEHNPISANIKFSSPTIYECAVIMAHRISEKTKIKINDSEIGYIALHIGNAMAEQITNKQRLSVAIIIPKYYDNAMVLLENLQKNFSAKINVIKVVHDPVQIKYFQNSIDLLISVGSDYIDSQFTTVCISQFLLPYDIKILNSAINNKLHQNRKIDFQNQLSHFFSKKNFITNKNIQNIDQVFNIVSKRFTQQGIVDKNFASLLNQREKMSSTAFGKVAIPHSLNMMAKKSRGFIIINPNGMRWSDNNKVYLVIALAIDPNNKQLFRDVFDELSNVVTNISNVSRLIKCNTYEQFIKNLVDML